jgi:maltose/maltodextrin transport system substrate-binding protein
MRIAEIVADYLLKISFPKGAAWEYLPPTYYGRWIAKLNQASWIKLDNLMPIYGTWAGEAYLDMYDYTRDKKYLQAAQRIAETFLKQQLSDGTWYMYVDPRTGDPTSSVGNSSIPTAMLNYFNRLKDHYGVTGLDSAIQKTFDWIMHNPVRTYNWHGQFEDVGTHEPYHDLTRKEACQFAIYLLKRYPNDSEYVKTAEELIRFSEDQFVIWEKPRLIDTASHSKIRPSTNWILPSAQEQYTYWMPTGPAAMRMMKAYWNAYKVTGEDIYLAKAKSMANSMTNVQKYHAGEYSTYFTKYTVDEWLNCNVDAAEEMIEFGNDLKK